MDEKLLTPSELAAHWGVKPKTSQKWRTMGYGPQYLKISRRILIPHVRVNKVIRFRLNEVKAWARQYKTQIDSQDGNAEAKPAGQKGVKPIVMERLSLI